jgi:hypothetical protein
MFVWYQEDLRMAMAEWHALQESKLIGIHKLVFDLLLSSKFG